MKHARWAWLALTLVVGGVILALPRASAHAAASAWSKPVQLFDTGGYTSYPVLSADSTGDVHLIFMSLNQRGRDITPTSTGSLMYARLHNGSWSTPVDVLVPPGGGIVNFPSMALSGDGYLHVVWQGGLTNQIYYSRAHVTQAGTAQGWTKPEALSDGSASGSTISASADRRLHLAFAAADGNVRYRHSDDGGHVWSLPLTLVDTEGKGSAADFPRLVVDQKDQIYLTWNQYQLPNGWPPVGAFSAMSLDGGDKWLPTTRVAPQNYGFVAVQPTSGETVYRVWNSTVGVGERRYQTSQDGGKTWDSAKPVPGLRGGFSGAPALALDTVGTLHLLTSVNLGGPQSAGGIYEVTLDQRGAWSDPAYVSEGVEGQTSVELPSLAVANGSKLYAVWEQDFGRIWYSGRVLDTPQDPPRVVPAPVSDPALRATSTAAPAPRAPISQTIPQSESVGQPAPTTTPRPAVAVAAEPELYAASPLLPLLATLVPSTLLILTVIAYRAIGRRRS